MGEDPFFSSLIQQAAVFYGAVQQPFLQKENKTDRIRRYLAEFNRMLTGIWQSKEIKRGLRNTRIVTGPRELAIEWT